MTEKTVHRILKMYEEKLREYMSPQEYRQFSERVARMTFAADVMESPNEDFKRMVFENWDAITAPIETEGEDDCD